MAVPDSLEQPEVAGGRRELIVAVVGIVALLATVAVAAVTVVNNELDAPLPDELGSEALAGAVGDDGSTDVAGGEPAVAGSSDGDSERARRPGAPGPEESNTDDDVPSPGPASSAAADPPVDDPNAPDPTPTAPATTDPAATDPTITDPTVTGSSTISTTTTTTAPAPSSTNTTTASSSLPSTTATTPAPATSTTVATTTTVVTTTTVPPGSPVAVADAISTRDDKDLRIEVLDNDDPGDANFDDSTLEIITEPRHADEVRVHGDHLHYRSVKDYEGTDTLRYRICNDDGLCHVATVTITVTD